MTIQFLWTVAFIYGTEVVDVWDRPISPSEFDNKNKQDIATNFLRVYKHIL